MPMGVSPKFDSFDRHRVKGVHHVHLGPCQTLSCWTFGCLAQRLPGLIGRGARLPIRGFFTTPILTRRRQLELASHHQTQYTRVRPTNAQLLSEHRDTEAITAHSLGIGAEHTWPQSLKTGTKLGRLFSSGFYSPPSATLAPPSLVTSVILLFSIRFFWSLYKIFGGWLRRKLPTPGRLTGVRAPILHGSQATEVSTLAPHPSLPPELVERIADFVFQPAPPAPNSSGATSNRRAKPHWQDVAGFMWASASLHRMGYRRWLQVISIKNIDDWNVITEHIELIREIHCYDGTLLDPKHQRILSKIPHLYTATIDAHGDVWHDEQNRFAYRDVLSALPPSLIRLEIEHAHGPDIKIISLVKQYCPKLEELILGRCTMFNRSPACDFWISFPHDHDAYMSNIGTDAYAHSLGGELAPLRHLRSLRVGLYFVPPDIVPAHRLYHRRGLAAPETIDWQSAIPLAELPTNLFLQEFPPQVELATTAQLVSLLHRCDEETRVEFKCQQCIDITGTNGSEAEQSANSILREYLPTLTSVEWMGWLTPQHLGVNSYQFSS